MRNRVRVHILLLAALVCAGVAARTAALEIRSTGARAQATAAPQEVPNTLTAWEQERGWKLLFDGKTTQGWRGFKQPSIPGGWQVVDGALTRIGGGGDVVTVDQYDSFELALDWKVAEGGNSGIMFRVSESAGETYHTGPEFQILDNARHADGKSPLTSAGSCYGLYEPIKDVTRPAGEWNQARLVVNGNVVEHWLNDVRVVRYELLSADWEKRVAASKFNEWPQYGRIPRGHIALQDHGDRVAYRNIRIRVMR
jgi:Domain of Unknown Function (DUF1080)